MLKGGVGAVGLLTLVALTGCTSDGAPGPTAGATVAVPGYESPQGAPGFCDSLAASRHTAELPAAVGMLTVDGDHEAAVDDLEEVIDDLEGVLDEVSGDDGNAAVTAALEDVLAAVHSATRNPVDDALLDRLAVRLETLGDAVQPLCEFPT
jgi:hypothetical protein